MCFPCLLRLELHYDDVHVEKYRERGGAANVPARKGEHKVFRKAVNSYRKKLCQRIELPGHIKAILRRPEDEDSWPRLEALREGIVRCILGAKTGKVLCSCAGEQC